MCAAVWRIQIPEAHGLLEDLMDSNPGIAFNCVVASEVVGQMWMFSHVTSANNASCKGKG